MSLLPFSFGDSPYQYGGGFENMFGVPSLFHPGVPGYVRPWRFQSGPESGMSQITNDKEKFEVSLDVKEYKPEEITVKNVENVITVEGKHEEKQDEHGYISRHFVRRYVLPKDVDIDHCKVSLSSDGVLNLHVPKKALPDGSKGRKIPITHTGAPAVKAAETKKK